MIEKPEQRKSLRRNIRIPIMCWEVHEGKADGRGLEIISHNLSTTGLAFESKNIYSLGSLFLAEIHLPGRKAPLICHLKVARLETVLGKESYLIGTTFADVKQEDANFIASCLEKMNLYTMLEAMLKANASDLHLTVGRPPILRVQGHISYLKSSPIDDGEIKAMIYPLLTNIHIEVFEKIKELDFAFSPNVSSRFRVNLHFQKGFLEAAIRSIPPTTKTFEQLGLSTAAMEKFCREKSGLLLIAGTTGSGKTTTVAAMVDYMNKNLEKVIITIEDPIEYIHASQKSIIKQRELGSDTVQYAEALKRALRQDPDVIVVGELLDKECVMAAIRAAEAGHLVVSTIHAPDSAQAIERIVHFFPPEHGPGICQQLSTCLIGIIFQLLVPSKTGLRALATEVLVATTAIKNLIREGKFYQILLNIQTGREHGMHTLENSLKSLYDKAVIDYGVFQEYTKPEKR